MALENESHDQRTAIQLRLSDMAVGDLTQLTPFEDLPNNVKSILKLHPSLLYDGTGRVHCQWSGHEMPCTITNIECYVRGKKYQQLRQYNEYNFDQYKPHIAPSNKKGHKHKLFCSLTLRHLTKSPKDVERHTKGRRYKRSVERFNQCQAEGIPFKPLYRVRRVDKQESDSDEKPVKSFTDSDENSEGETDDSMTDLYPAEDFRNDENVGATPSTAAETQSGTRKLVVEENSNKVQQELTNTQKRKGSKMKPKANKLKRPKQLKTVR